MTIYDLYEQLKCPKRHVLNQVILSKNYEIQLLFKSTVLLLCKDLVQRTEWQYVEKKLRNKLFLEYKEEWFTVEWQKRKVIREDIRSFKRLYYWLLTNMKGTCDCSVKFHYPYVSKIHDDSASEIELIADLLIRESDGSLTGIIIVPQLALKGSQKKRSIKTILRGNLELLMLLSCMSTRFPEENISVMALALKPKQDNDILSSHAEYSDELRIKISMNDFQTYTKMDIDEVIVSEIENFKMCSCKQCDYKEVCKPSGRIHFRKDKQELVSDTISYTEKQWEAIQCMNGPMRVSAGPGAGKTATLVARIQHLIESGVPQNRILAVTFTKKAAKEIQERIPNNESLHIMTLHALGFMILRMNECWIGRKRLVNKVDCKKMLHDLLRKLPELQGFSYEHMNGKNGFLEQLLLDFSLIEKSGTDKFTEMFPQKDIEGILRVKEMYDNRYRYAGYISYEDQISYAVKILENHTSALKRLQEMYDYVLIDEAQDLDEKQVKLIKLLVKAPEYNLTIFGDSDQSIYGFRGGNNRFMVEFEDIYPGTKDFRLDDNFRSSKEILQASNHLIEHNKGRVPFTMQSHFETGIKPVLLQSFCMEQLGNFINALLQKGVYLGDIAIIARTNKELDSLCHMIEAYNKKYPDSAILKYEKPKHYLFEDYVFQTLLDLLAIHQGNYHDDLIWYRLLSGNGVNLAKENPSLCLYDNWISHNQIYALHDEERTRYLSVTDEDSVLLQTIARIYRTTQFFFLEPREAIQKICEYYFDANIEYEETLQILDDMLRERYIKNAFDMYRFFSAIKIYQDNTRVTYDSEQSDHLHLLTAHDSKGKEFPVVMIYGVDEFDGDDIEEDRRLLYVAMTRAKKQLYFTEIRKGKSIFLREIEGLIEIGGENFEKNVSVW